MGEVVRPTINEVKRFIIQTIRHSYSVEYYVSELNKLPGLKVGLNDKDRPHDISGQGNKFLWDVLCGLSIGYRQSLSPEEKKIFEAARELHRTSQYHHKIWNSYNPKVQQSDLALSAIDSLCFMTEDRADDKKYRSMEDSEYMNNMIENQQFHQKMPLKSMYSRLRNIKQPEFSRILSPFDIPNLGLPKETHDKIIAASFGVVAMLQNSYGYDL